MAKLSHEFLKLISVSKVQYFAIQNTFTTSIDVFARKCQRQARSHVLHDFLMFDQSKRFLQYLL